MAENGRPILLWIQDEHPGTLPIDYNRYMLGTNCATIVDCPKALSTHVSNVFHKEIFPFGDTF